MPASLRERRPPRQGRESRSPASPESHETELAAHGVLHVRRHRVCKVLLYCIGTVHQTAPDHRSSEPYWQFQMPRNLAPALTSKPVSDTLPPHECISCDRSQMAKSCAISREFFPDPSREIENTDRRRTLFFRTSLKNTSCMTGRTQKYLLIKGCAGIGNRLFTLASAIRYAKASGRAVIVDWRDGVFAAAGKDAFRLFFRLEGVQEGDLGLISTTDNSFSVYPTPMKEHLQERLYDCFAACSSVRLKLIPRINHFRGRLSRLSQFWYFRPGDNFNKPIFSDSAALSGLFSGQHLEYGHKLSLHHKEDVVIFADYWPRDVAGKDFSQIRISHELLQKAQKLADEIGINKSTVGLHIRCSDKKPGKEFGRLRQLLERQVKQGWKIFLATDNQSIETEFQSCFGPSLLALPKFYPNNNNEENIHQWSMRQGDYSHAERIYEESLLDILLLASCPCIYYQGNSSFSRISLILNDGRSEARDWLKMV